MVSILTGIIAALLSGFLLGWLHYALKPKRLSRVEAYVIGSVSCLFFSIGAMIATDYFDRLTAAGGVVILGLVWGWSGAVVAFSYWVDDKASKKRIGKHG